MTDKIIGAEKVKKPVIAFTAYDANNAKFGNGLRNSLRKFHTESELPLYELQGKELEEYTKNDPQFWYRQKPVIASKFINDYECVIGLDADQIITGDLSYIWKTKDYDVATVINYNRGDAQTYGPVTGWGILPIEYFNCGLVAMRNPKFVQLWLDQCRSERFDHMQYREQDLLNAMCYFGNWNVRCLDHGDGPAKMNAFWGLIAKSDYPRAHLVDNDIVIPKGEGDTPFPPIDMKVNIIHFAEGNNNPQKGNYRTMFNDEKVIKRLDYLISPANGEEKRK